MKNGVQSSSGRVSHGMAGNRVRVVLPSVPVREATLAGLKEQMRSASRAKAQAEAVRVRAAAEYSRRMGQKAAERTLREESGQSANGSRVEVEIAGKLKGLPDTRKAFEDGEITFGHTKIIANTARRVDVDEQELVDRAKNEPVDVFARTARRHEQQQSEDDGLSKLEAQRRARKAGIKTDPSDGMTVLWGRFDPITGTRIKNLLTAKTNQLWRAEDPKDRPTTEQRMADALAELLCRPGGGKKGKKSKTQRADLLLIAHWDTGEQKIRNATLADGTPIPVALFKDMACQGKVVPAIFDTKGRPLWVGLGKRLATPSQRLALIARDRRCVGCGADPAWCQAHHVIPWEADGPTDIDNLVLLCSRCHHQVHDEKWQIRKTPTDKYVLQPPSSRHRQSMSVKTPNRRGRERKRSPD
ncbi:MAG: DUF222 domain-containing protein [Acidimicrobiia bacterium]|nr:DUF222 domain-containing protein [Acidimicrobiia bacterium]